MAYKTKQPKDRQPLDTSGANPYESMTGPTATAQAAPPPGSAAPTAPEQPYGGALATGEGADSGPSATGYVNFDRIYGANQDVAAREAKSRGDAAKGKAQGAQAGLTGLQGKFSAGLTGATNAGPSATDYQYATGQSSFAQPRDEAIAGRNKQGATASPQPLGPHVNDPTEADWRANLEAGAKKGYGGPEALSASDEYGKLAQDTEAAQQAINNPTTGLNQTDAALLGAAGRPRYAELQQQYGNLKGDLEKANAASIEQAKAAADASKTGENQYSRLLSDYDANKAAANADTSIHMPAAPGVGNASTVLGSAPGQRALSTMEQWTQLKKDFGLHPDDGGHLPEDEEKLLNDVMSSMSEKEQAELAAMTPEQRKAWWEQQKKAKGLE